MLGFINCTIRDFVKETFGEDTWVKLCAAAGVDIDTTFWLTACPYADALTYNLVVTAAGMLNISLETVLEGFGGFFVTVLCRQGFEPLLRCLGADMAELMSNLNNLHLHLAAAYPGMIAPAFRCDHVTSTSVELHYFSQRASLGPIVKGILQAAARKLFDVELTIQLLRGRDAGTCDHEVFRVQYPIHARRSGPTMVPEGALGGFGLDPVLFGSLFPFHILLDSEMRVLQAGSVLSTIFPSLAPGRHLNETFKVHHPHDMPMTYKRVRKEAHTVFLLRSVATGLELKGQMLATNLPLPPGPRVTTNGTPAYSENQVPNYFGGDIHSAGASPYPLSRLAPTSAGPKISINGAGAGAACMSSMGSNVGDRMSHSTPGAGSGSAGSGPAPPSPQVTSAAAAAAVAAAAAQLETGQPQPQSASQQHSSLPSSMQQQQSMTAAQRHLHKSISHLRASGAVPRTDPGSGSNPPQIGSILASSQAASYTLPKSSCASAPALNASTQNDGSASSISSLFGLMSDITPSMPNQYRPPFQHQDSSCSSYNESECGSHPFEPLRRRGPLLLSPRTFNGVAPAGTQQVLLFMGSPRVSSLEEMLSHKLFLSDIPLHDMSRDFVLMLEQRQAETAVTRLLEKLTVDLKRSNEQLALAKKHLEAEQVKSDALLYRMLPLSVADELRGGSDVKATMYNDVTVLFSDIVGFTVTSSRCTPEEVYSLLNELYIRFDALVDSFPHTYKLETIGDAYMLVCNLTTPCDDHVDQVIDFAIRMQAEARLVKTVEGEPVRMRVGIHTGNVVGGVMGNKTPRFSIIGDTVNTASRMETHGLPGEIHISKASYLRIRNKSKYTVRERGAINIKGKGLMTTYLIGGINDTWLLQQQDPPSACDSPLVTRLPSETEKLLRCRHPMNHPHPADGAPGTSDESTGRAGRHATYEAHAGDANVSIVGAYPHPPPQRSTTPHCGIPDREGLARLLAGYASTGTGGFRPAPPEFCLDDDPDRPSSEFIPNGSAEVIRLIRDNSNTTDGTANRSAHCILRRRSIADLAAAQLANGGCHEADSLIEVASSEAGDASPSAARGPSVCPFGYGAATAPAAATAAGAMTKSNIHGAQLASSLHQTGELSTVGGQGGPTAHALASAGPSMGISAFSSMNASGVHAHAHLTGPEHASVVRARGHSVPASTGALGADGSGSGLRNGHEASFPDSADSLLDLFAGTSRPQGDSHVNVVRVSTFSHGGDSSGGPSDSQTGMGHDRTDTAEGAATAGGHHGGAAGTGERTSGAEARTQWRKALDALDIPEGSAHFTPTGIAASFIRFNSITSRLGFGRTSSGVDRAQSGPLRRLLGGGRSKSGTTNDGTVCADGLPNSFSHSQSGPCSKSNDGGAELEGGKGRRPASLESNNWRANGMDLLDGNQSSEKGMAEASGGNGGQRKAVMAATVAGEQQPHSSSPREARKRSLSQVASKLKALFLLKPTSGQVADAASFVTSK